MNDPLSDIFELIKLKGCVYFQRDFHSPWGMKIEGTGFAQFHVITRGTCVVQVKKERHECSVGDILLYPKGASHSLSDKAGRKAIPGPVVMNSFASNDPLFNTGNEYTRLVCGHYQYRTDITHPIITDLPDFIHLRSLDLLQTERTSSVLSLLMGELAQPLAGTRLIVERYAEILLSYVLRVFVAQNPNQHGFISAIMDQRLSKAIERIHHDFASKLNLRELAGEAALSRSAFAQRFKETAGMSPIEYLSKWRMLKAGDMLKATDLPIAQVSEKVGYDSNIAFTRAFKREYGITPSRFRTRI